MCKLNKLKFDALEIHTISTVSLKQLINKRNVF